ncbi:hypothetical protein [Mucilaginibacter boryungensis]|uniref:Chemotaxis methyl-accepting receptor HlyB-like 4HB MCP domain-containing protein n=1 Tax=Mucilaginibacter boryungensis TaxID=768480 RepID=A0ABR9XH59_9SPHI|nr:hypothetical protein [Mucilaginibacter boryungensis]MBE9666517.1 hypothetical protein [Mucilaginibacter boryungensis]
MKKVIIHIVLLFAVLSACAQTKSDSLAYQLQRKKINGMLAVRREKYGQYEQSLSKHTGIFGLQTKKDIRRSNDILTDIVATDDEIFIQLKILLDYRAFEQKQVQNQVQSVKKSTLGYMTTINKLRNQIDTLKKTAEDEQAHQAMIEKILFAIIALMFLSILFIINRKRAINS